MPWGGIGGRPERRSRSRAGAAESLVAPLVLGVELHEVAVHLHLGGEPLGATVLLGGGVRESSYTMYRVVFLTGYIKIWPSPE